MKTDSNATPSPLPYRDTKPVGAADFYFAINSTFQFILKRFGMNGLRQYWADLGTQYMAPVSAAWKQRGWSGVAEYWRAFFKAEPGAEVEVNVRDDSVVLDVKTCPAIAHLRKHKREILPCFCQHCYYMGEATAAAAGLTVRVEGGNGSCRQTFHRQNAQLPEQNLAKIKEATC